MTIVHTQLNISRVLALGLSVAETAPQILDLFCRLNNFQVCAWYQPDDLQIFRLFELKVADPAVVGDIAKNSVPKEVSVNPDVDIEQSDGQQQTLTMIMLNRLCYRR